MPRMRSLKKKTWRYDKQEIAPGAVFNVTKPGDVTVLTLSKIAELVDAQASKDETKAPKAKAPSPHSTSQHKAAQAKPSEKNLSEMTVPELRQTAKAMGVMIGPSERKSDIIDLLRHKYGRRDMRATD